MTEETPDNVHEIRPGAYHRRAPSFLSIVIMAGALAKLEEFAPGAEPWVAITLALDELQELRSENNRLKEENAGLARNCRALRERLAE